MTESNDEDLFADLDATEHQFDRTKIIQGPMNYPGSKLGSLDQLLPLLPYRNGFCEPCAGSAVVLLNRRPSPLEILNDRFDGITNTYRVIRDPESFQALMDRLDLTIHGREEYYYSRDSWAQARTDVERAALWLYSVIYSFGGKGQAFGRGTSGTLSLAGRIRDRLPQFFPIHERLRNVQIENLDAIQCLLDFDSLDMVFYVDPPYYGSSNGIYKHQIDHEALLKTIQSLKGFVALSGYPHPLYDDQEWDAVHSWDVTGSMRTRADESIGTSRIQATERLWIKEARG